MELDSSRGARLHVMLQYQTLPARFAGIVRILALDNDFVLWRRNAVTQAAPSKPKTALQSVPTYLRRRLWIFMSIIAVGSVASFVVPLLIMGRVPISFYVAACALPGLAIGAAAVVTNIGFANEVRRAMLAKCKVCWDCGYPLDGLHESGTCPECGRQYELSELEALWKAADDKRQGKRRTSDVSA